MKKPIREIKRELISIAASLVRRDCMPPTYICDYGSITARTPRKVIREILELSERADAYCLEMGVRIRDLADALPIAEHVSESTNDQDSCE